MDHAQDKVISHTQRDFVRISVVLSNIKIQMFAGKNQSQNCICLNQMLLGIE